MPRGERDSTGEGAAGLADCSVGRPRHLLIILNRRAAQRRMDRFRAVLALLDVAGCTYEVKETHAAGDAARFAQEAAAETVDVVAVAGGDGTINDAINGFHPATPPLGLIPLGTANVLAHEIGLATDPTAIAAALTMGRCLSVVPGRANGRRFMMMASIGFDAHVVAGVPRSVKRRIGKLAYVLAALRQLIRYPCPHLTALVDGRPVTAATVVVSRGRLYGGRYIMAPEADLAMPEFQVSIFRRKGRLAMAGYAAALPMGLLNRWNLIDHVVARRVEVRVRPGDPVQVDGDTATALPVVIDLADQAIEVLVPPYPSASSVGASRNTTCLARS